MNLNSNSFFNTLTISSSQGRLFCFFKQNKGIEPLLLLFRQLGLIHGYLPIEKKLLYKIFLKQNSQGQPMIKKIIIWSTPGKQIFVSVSQLSSVHFKDILVETLLATDKGIVNAQRALFSNIGGLLLCRIII